MNDRFKFRVWCKECKEWEKDQVAITNKGNYIINFSDQNFTRVTNIDPVRHEINFCTGLKDKNGKLIYEGDIVEQAATKYVVNWLDGTFCFLELETSHNFTIEYVMPNKQEVIGNIYENPELLKESKNE